MGSTTGLWRPAETQTESMIKAVDKAIKYAQNNLIPKGYSGAYFSRETGQLTDWVVGEREVGNGFIFIHYTDFKYRGTEDEYIAHLEQLVNELSQNRSKSEKTESERLVCEAVSQLSTGMSIEPHSSWAKDAAEFARSS